VVVTTPSDFRAAVREYGFNSFAFDDNAIDAARASLADAGLIVVGEPHGVYETPGVVYALAVALGTRAVAFEWSHEEMDEPVQEFLGNGPFDFERLWTLPPSAEFFCGDGRITTGHFALLQRLRDEGRLDQVIAFDRLDPEPHPGDWRIRDKEMAERLLAHWRDSVPLLLVTGASHATLDAQLEPKGGDDGGSSRWRTGRTCTGHAQVRQFGSDAAGTDHISAPRGDACLRPGSAIR
jgi:hypothetical protein